MAFNNKKKNANYISAKDLPKGTSEAPVLSESECEHRSKDILWGEGKRKRFPLQPFAEGECFS